MHSKKNCINYVIKSDEYEKTFKTTSKYVDIQYMVFVDYDR